MNNRKCIRCKENRSESDYSDNRAIVCSICKSLRLEKWKTKNSDKIKEYATNYRKENRDYLKEEARRYYKDIPIEQKRIKNKIGYNKSKNRPDYFEKRKVRGKKYEQKNKERRKEQRRKRHRKRYKEDLRFKIEVLLRTRFYKAVKRRKIKSVIELVGCSREDLIKYLEERFKPEMNWANHGRIWEIDHIIPIVRFNLIKIEEQIKCFHYTNLQPLFKTTDIANSFGYNETGNNNKRK